jgi:hypothetical protein
MAFRKRYIYVHNLQRAFINGITNEKNNVESHWRRYKYTRYCPGRPGEKRGPRGQARLSGCLASEDEEEDAGAEGAARPRAKGWWPPEEAAAAAATTAATDEEEWAAILE